MKRIRVKKGFLILLAVLFYLDEGVGLLPRGLLAAALHEAGHYAAGRAFGGRLEWVELSAVGARMSISYSAALSYGHDIAVSLAGPMMNLVLAWLSAGQGWYLFASVNLALAGFNLLPMVPLDGGQALYCALSCLAGQEWAEGVLSAAAAILVGLLGGFGAVVAVRFANVSLLVVSVWLLWMIIGRKREKK